MKVELIYITAGGGHLASSRALAAGIAEQRPDWRVQQFDLFQLLDPQDQFRRMTGQGPADFYNKRLARGWTLGMVQELKLLQLGISLLHERFCTQLQQHWLATRPDLVVSLVPNFNRAMYQGLRAARPDTPFVTLLTDLADNPPNFWIERDQSQDLICGTAKACEQALAAGYPATAVHRTSGMVLHPDFHRPLAFDRAAERVREQLDPDLPTAVVSFGGTGSSRMLAIARRLPNVQLILLCGRNRALAGRLRSLPAAAPRCIVEYTDNIAHYMRLADFFIGKPGPGSISEAVALRLPVIVESNAWTMPQELYNASWIDQNRLGIVVPSLERIGPAVAALTRHLPLYHAQVDRIRNRAVFEIPAILERIHERRRADRQALRAA
jgi:hypothetical protein